jgi:hypothetical protein
MSKTFKGGIAVTAAVLLAATLLVTGCPNSEEPGPNGFALSGTITVNETPVASLDEMKSRMASLAGSGASSASPIRVTIAITNASQLSGTNGGGTDPLHKLFDAIPDDAFITYDLSGCTFTDIQNITAGIAEARTNNANLVSITLPDTLATIGDWAFAYCSSLTSITIPASVTSIGGSVFSNCSGLTQATIPDSVTSIGNYAFYKCSDLTSVYVLRDTLPLTTLGYYGVQDANASLRIYVPASTVAAYKAIVYWTSYSSKIQAIP